MKCPLCKAQSRVTDSREDLRIGGTRRRRQCSNGHRFSTSESYIETELPGHHTLMREVASLTKEMVRVRARMRALENELVTLGGENGMVAPAEFCKN